MTWDWGYPAGTAVHGAVRGEAQRIKLWPRSCPRRHGKDHLILDEPTTGLHFADVHELIDIPHRLLGGRQHGCGLLEHNLDVIKTADYIIDIGPKAGTRAER